MAWIYIHILALYTDNNTCLCIFTYKQILANGDFKTTFNKTAKQTAPPIPDITFGKPSPGRRNIAELIEGKFSKDQGSDSFDHGLGKATNPGFRNRTDDVSTNYHASDNTSNNKFKILVHFFYYYFYHLKC